MRIGIAAIILFICSCLFSQPFQNVRVSLVGPWEPSISINPKNIDQLVAGSNVNLFHFSTDGGLTWSSDTLSSQPYGVMGDPCIAADTSGNFYYFHLSNPPGGYGHWIDRIVCQKSTDGGATWSNPGSYTYYVPVKQQDKEWAAVDWTHGSRRNWIYCTWTQFDRYASTVHTDSSNILFARSTDAGLSWVGVTRINELAGDCIDKDNTVEGAVPAVGPNGEVYVAWAGPKIKNVQYGIFFDRSTDGGNTWLNNDIYVCDQPGGWDQTFAGISRSNGLPVTVCDISGGPYRGNIYINYTDSVGPADHDVKIVKSTNGGFNWSQPIRVNNDPPGREQFLTWTAIDMITGYVYIVFYDRRNYPDTQTDVYLARSTDGGNTFENIKISESPFNPINNAFIGDYLNITVHNGRVRPIWQRFVSGNYSLWTAIIEFPIAVKNQNETIPDKFELFQNYPNPFNPSTKIKFTVPAEEYATMNIFDITGKQVGRIVNESMKPGTYEINFSSENLSSGIYFYRMQAGKFSAARKMIYLK